MTDTTQNTITLDAKGAKIGRIASEASRILQGKDRADYAPNVVTDVKVVIENADALAITDKKADEKIYQRYTQYPGGLRERTLNEVVAKKGIEEVLRHAVHGMLPSNKLRARIMKNLVITN